MKLKNDFGITLPVLVLTIIIMMILFVVSARSFNPYLFNDIEEVQQESNELKIEQDKEIQNAIDGLGGIN